MAHILHTTGASVWSRRGEFATGSDANRALATGQRAVESGRSAGGRRPNPWTRWRPEYSTFGPSDASTRLFRAKRTCSPPSPRIRIVPLSRFFRAKRGRFPCANPGRLPLMRQSKISPIHPIRAFYGGFLPVDNVLTAVGCSGHSQIALPPRRASARRSGSPGAIGRLSGVSKHQSAPPRRSCSGRPATASRGGVPLPARGWLDALGSSSAPELRMIPGPPPAINGKHMTTTATSRHAKIGVETPSRPRAHTGEIWRDARVRAHSRPKLAVLHQPPGPCRASEDARRHRAGGRQEPAARLHPPEPDERGA